MRISATIFRSIGLSLITFKVSMMTASVAKITFDRSG